MPCNLSDWPLFWEMWFEDSLRLTFLFNGSFESCLTLFRISLFILFFLLGSCWKSSSREDSFCYLCLLCDLPCLSLRLLESIFWDYWCSRRIDLLISICFNYYNFFTFFLLCLSYTEESCWTNFSFLICLVLTMLILGNIF